MNVYYYIIGGLLGLGCLAHGQGLTHEQHVITQTLLGEARGEGKAGLYAVACIIKRRVELKSYTRTAARVCLQDSQFDYWTQHKRVKWDDINRSNVRQLMQTNTELVRYAKMLAININRVDTNFIKQADHYCHIKEHNYWTKGKKPVSIIENHKFYRLR